MSRKAVGLSLFVGLSLAGFTPFAIQAWRDVRAFYVFEEGRCTVVSRGSYTTLGNRASSTTPAPQRRHPELMYKVDAAGAHYFAFGFDNMRGRLSSMSDAEPWQVGKTYPCWYDPANPETAILKREVRPKFYAAAAIPAFMLLVTVGMLRAELREKRKREQPPEVARGELARDFTSESRVRTGIGCLAVYTPIALVGSWWLLKTDIGFWGFVLFLLAGEAAIIARLRYVIRMRHLGDPVVEIDGDSALVRLTTHVPLKRFAIELEVDGERTPLYEAKDVSGAISRRVDVEEDSTLVIIQATEAGEVETTFKVP